MVKTLPSDAARLFYGAILAPGTAAPGLSQTRHFWDEQQRLDRLLELRAVIESLRHGRELERACRDLVNPHN